jgi:glycosyltransferase involved in cell wall biosynthesis
VSFDQRADWYLDSDAVILINKIGVENTMAWRTRLVDYVWADLPIITNGGDPLSEILKTEKAVEILPSLETKNLAKSLENLAKSPEQLESFAKNMNKVRKRLYWDVNTKNLARLIENGYKPADIAARQSLSMPSSRAGKISRARAKAHNAVVRTKRYAKNYGTVAAGRIIAQKVSRKAKYVAKKFVKKPGANLVKKAPRIVVVSHQLDHSGAPYVIMDLVSDMAKKYPKLTKSIRFITFTPFENDNIVKLKKAGISTEIYTNPNLSIDLNEGDVVLMNSLSMSRPVIFSVLNAVKAGKIKHAFWYAHEATPEGFIDADVREIIKKLLANGKLSIYETSEKTRQEYVKFFGTENGIIKMPYRFNFPDEKFRVLSFKEFDKLNFYLPGSALDSRKGQLPILYAFLDFYDNYFRKYPKKYRDFSLKFVGVDGDNYAIKQLKLSAKGLGDRVSIMGGVPHEKSLEYDQESNITICYSIHEALPVYVYEGMAFGHPIIRNESAGQEEQLREGKNGIEVRSDDFNGLVHAIERILNLDKTSNKSLASMSAESVKIARAAAKRKFIAIDDIYDVFIKTN